MGIKQTLLKMLSIVDYVEKREDIQMETQIAYDSSMSHQGRYVHDEGYETLIFESLSEFNNFESSCRREFHDMYNHRKYLIMSVAFTTGKDGRNLIVASCIGCTCDTCHNKALAEEYSQYFDTPYTPISRYKNIDMKFI